MSAAKPADFYVLEGVHVKRVRAVPHGPRALRLVEGTVACRIIVPRRCVQDTPEDALRAYNELLIARRRSLCSTINEIDAEILRLKQPIRVVSANGEPIIPKKVVELPAP